MLDDIIASRKAEEEKERARKTEIERIRKKADSDIQQAKALGIQEVKVMEARMSEEIRRINAESKNSIDLLWKLEKDIKKRDLKMKEIMYVTNTRIDKKKKEFELAKYQNSVKTKARCDSIELDAQVAIRHA